MNCQISSNWPPIWSVRMATNILFRGIESWETFDFFLQIFCSNGQKVFRPKIGFLYIWGASQFLIQSARREDIIVNNKYTEIYYKANNTLFSDATIKYLNIHRHFLQQLCTQTDRYVEQSGGPSLQLCGLSQSKGSVLAFSHWKQKPNAGFDVGHCRNKIIDKNRGNKNIKSITKNGTFKTSFECLNLRSDTLQPGEAR